MASAFVTTKAAALGERGLSTGRALVDAIPDARDGLTRVERIVLYCLHEAQRERSDRHVPTLMLYGRVCEHIDITPGEFQRVLQRMVGLR